MMILDKDDHDVNDDADDDLDNDGKGGRASGEWPDGEEIFYIRVMLIIMTIMMTTMMMTTMMMMMTMMILMHW